MGQQNPQKIIQERAPQTEVTYPKERCHEIEATHKQINYSVKSMGRYLKVLVLQNYKCGNMPWI